MIATLSPAAVEEAAAPACELADIFRQYGEAYRRTHRLGSAQRKAMWDLVQRSAFNGQLSAISRNC